MGAYSLLCRRLDGARAQKLMLSGNIYTAEELEEMGLVDVVVEPGEGPDAVRDYLERNRRRHDTLCALSRVRQHCQPVSYEELIAVTSLWVETALRLDDADLRRMEHLVRAQQRRHERNRVRDGDADQCGWLIAPRRWVCSARTASRAARSCSKADSSRTA